MHPQLHQLGAQMIFFVERRALEIPMTLQHHNQPVDGAFGDMQLRHQLRHARFLAILRKRLQNIEGALKYIYVVTGLFLGLRRLFHQSKSHIVAHIPKSCLPSYTSDLRLVKWIQRCRERDCRTMWKEGSIPEYAESDLGADQWRSSGAERS